MPLLVQHWFRLTGIPQGWTHVGVLGALKSLEPTILQGDLPSPISLSCLQWIGPNWTSQTGELLGISRKNQVRPNQVGAISRGGVRNRGDR
jgi:hypothetical protein